MICPCCGEDLPDESLKFCDQCGATLQSIAQPVPASATEGMVILGASLAPPRDDAPPAAAQRAPAGQVPVATAAQRVAHAELDAAAGSERFVPFASRPAFRGHR
jgi:hypothetical protein